MADTKSARMTQEQFYQLCRQVEAHAERYKTERPHFATVAREMAKAMGLAVNDVQVKRAAAMVGCLWEPAKASRGPEPSRVREQVRGMTARLDELEKRNDEDHKELGALTGRVRELRKQFDELNEWILGTVKDHNENIEEWNAHKTATAAEIAALRGVVVKLCEEMGVPLPPGMVPANGKLPFAVAGK